MTIQEEIIKHSRVVVNYHPDKDSYIVTVLFKDKSISREISGMIADKDKDKDDMAMLNMIKEEIYRELADG